MSEILISNTQYSKINDVSGKKHLLLRKLIEICDDENALPFLYKILDEVEEYIEWFHIKHNIKENINGKVFPSKFTPKTSGKRKWERNEQLMKSTLATTKYMQKNKISKQKIFDYNISKKFNELLEIALKSEDVLF